MASTNVAAIHRDEYARRSGPWFTHTMQISGILAIILAAVTNLVILRLAHGWRPARLSKPMR